MSGKDFTPKALRLETAIKRVKFFANKGINIIERFNISPLSKILPPNPWRDLQPSPTVASLIIPTTILARVSVARKHPYHPLDHEDK
ncbi:hypothetical protein KEJ49_03765 [Candidatus Bathyarchaeota archaeon]|nr:hypothetical protein [Candidatus Bathyarchaeota archaeon]